MREPCRYPFGSSLPTLAPGIHVLLPDPQHTAIVYSEEPAVTAFGQQTTTPTAGNAGQEGGSSDVNNFQAAGGNNILSSALTNGENNWQSIKSGIMLFDQRGITNCIQFNEEKTGQDNKEDLQTSQPANIDQGGKNGDMQGKKSQRNRGGGRISSIKGKKPAYEKASKTIISPRKTRICWTPELHNKFLEAIRALGTRKLSPKAVLRMMDDPNLTLRQVASHLQKHKTEEKIYSGYQLFKTDQPLVQSMTTSKSTQQQETPSRVQKHMKEPATPESEKLRVATCSPESQNELPKELNDIIQKLEAAMGLSPDLDNSNDMIVEMEDSMELSSLPSYACDLIRNLEADLEAAIRSDLPPNNSQGVNQEQHVETGLAPAPKNSYDGIQEREAAAGLTPWITYSYENLQELEAAAMEVQVEALMGQDHAFGEPLNENQPPEKCDEIMNVIEELESIEDLGDFSNPAEIDKYCAWLKEAIAGESSNI